MAYFLIISLCIIFLFAGLILLGAFLPSETVGRFERFFSGSNRVFPKDDGQEN